MENDKKELVDFAVTVRKYKTTLTAKFTRRKNWQKPVPGEIRSVLPGTVISLHIKEGDSVNAGDLILIHEAMKMQNRVLAPVSGQVERICVTEGEKVAKDVLMVVIG